MSRMIKAGEADAVRRRVRFHVVLVADGQSPALDEAGGQPQISIDDAAFGDAGIGPLVAVGHGRYHATLDAAAVDPANLGKSIETRYKGPATAEIPGDSVQVVGFDPAAAVALGADGLDAVVVEAGINGRQALALAISNLAGEVGGAAEGEFVFAAAGDPATIRIRGQADEAGNRSAITLTPPA